MSEPRRQFLSKIIGGGVAGLLAETKAAANVPAIRSTPKEDISAYLTRTRGKFDITAFRQILGAANEFKEGDVATGVAAADDDSRRHARMLLANTRIQFLLDHPVYEDSVSEFIARGVDRKITAKIAPWTFGELRTFLLTKPEAEIRPILPGLPSDVISCVVKLMSNDDLTAIGQKIFNPLPGSKIGAKGYLGARVQPNSPTDHPDDIQWQVFNAFSFAVGDVVLGTNPVSSVPESVLAVENALKDILVTFGLEDTMPHCVLAHIDVQAEVEQKNPGSTAIWFQSLAGVADANATFDLTVEKLIRHAAARTGKYGLYFETGQGADQTNGHGKGFDILMHEARNYGFARALKAEVAKAQQKAGRKVEPWVHVNDVAGFIGPEVFRTKEQLVRCCLEDTAMGKLHGLTIGLDICSTLHMSVDLDDLDWCIDRVMPANPAYLMALPTKNDPMLSYLTTAFQDHVRVREKFGYKVNDAMWAFFQTLGVIDKSGKPTAHFGDPAWVYLQYRRRKQDARSDQEIRAEAGRKMEEVRPRGVDIAEGHGKQIWDLEPKLDSRIRSLYADAKKCLWAELPANFESTLPGAIGVRTLAKDREDYILHPPTGEALDSASEALISRLAARRAGQYDVQLVMSDGLNALALTDDGHLAPYLKAVREQLAAAGYKLAPEPIVVRGGRVRAGYRIGEMLYGKLPDRDSPKVVLHLIGERPGSGHHAYSVYLTSTTVRSWSETGSVDHNITKVVSGIADTAFDPAKAAEETVKILGPRK
jgi:ethanolamine ammonia-lyase large subunit